MLIIVDLTLHVPIHFGEHDVVGRTGIDVVTFGTDGGKFTFEVYVRRDARVLELTQAFEREEIEVAVGYNGFESSLSIVRGTVLLSCEPTKEVSRSIVQQVRNEVMTDTDVGFSLSVGKGRSFAVKSHRHRHVARQITCVQVGCGMIVTMSLVRFAQTICGFLSVGLEEIAVGMSPPDLISRELQGHLFDDPLPDEGLKFVRAHNNLGFGCRRDTRR